MCAVTNQPSRDVMRKRVTEKRTGEKKGRTHSIFVMVGGGEPGNVQIALSSLYVTNTNEFADRIGASGSGESAVTIRNIR